MSLNLSNVKNNVCVVVDDVQAELDHAKEMLDLFWNMKGVAGQWTLLRISDPNQAEQMLLNEMSTLVDRADRKVMVILDNQMPGKSGVEIAEGYRKKEADENVSPEARLPIYSYSSDNEQLKAKYADIFNGFIPKRMTIPALVKMGDWN